MTDQPATAGSPGKGLLGAPLVFQREIRLDHPLHPGDFPQLVELIARTAHRRGQSQVTGGVLHWQNTSDVEELTVTVTPGQERTCIRLVARYGGLAAVVYFAAFFTGLFLTAACGGFALGIRSLVGALSLAPVGLVVSYLVGRYAWRGLARRRQQELAALVETLARQGTGNHQATTV